MSTIDAGAAVPATTAPLRGTIRQLRPSELPLFRDHLLRLRPGSRNDRFGHGVSDDFIADYACRNFARGALVLGYLFEGAAKGAAELHERAGMPEPTGEIALSVDGDLRRCGIGTRLLSRLIVQAEWLGYAKLRVTTSPDNQPMNALARKFGARFVFEDGETVGLIHPGGVSARAA